MSEILDQEQRITNIRHLQAYPYDWDGFSGGVEQDVPRMLASVALDAKVHDSQRTPFNSHISQIGKDASDRPAKRFIQGANDFPVTVDDIVDHPLVNENMWIGVKRLDAWYLAGSVLVKKGVSLIGSNGETIIDNGIIVEAVTTKELKHELPQYYEAGIAVAESMVTEANEVVFSIETAESYVDRQSRIERWIKGKLTFDEVVHQSVFANYSLRSNPVDVRRSDFRGKATKPAIIYTNSKSVIDLTSAS